MTEDQAVHPDAANWGGWSWDEPMRGEHFRRCGYCGSVHPDDLAAEPVWHANWADRKYGYPHKFYVDIPNRDPGALFVVSSSYGGTDVRVPDGAVAWGDLTPEQLAIADRDGWGRGDPKPHFLEFGTRPAHFGKFYTVHLSDPAIGATTKEAIERRSGLRFTFTGDGRVGWAPWPPNQAAGR